MIKVVGFDYGGVLYGAPGSLFSKTMADVAGVEVERYYEVYFRHNHLPTSAGMDQDEFWHFMADELGVPDRGSALVEATHLYKIRNPKTLNADVLDVAHSLARTGLRIAMFSNTNPEGAEGIRKNLSNDPTFELLMMSCEVGASKPSREAYEAFCRALGIGLSELAYIDDSEKSLTTAGSLGFTPILYESAGKLEEDLRGLGLL